jgi:FlaA1/EpsC-like NDP-sugar epimerase
MERYYQGKKILVIGGTGTIGRHLVRRLLQDDPAVIRIFSRDEFKQFEMQQELAEHRNLRYLIGDVRDAERVLRAMEDIDIVFHLAAMKQVPACEYNPFEAVQTNVIGTQNVIQAALSAGVKRVLFTSTDKAISPTNTYGATKLTAEKLISAAAYHKGSKETVFSSVRFGNVMGSRGSVIPLFVKQIREHRKITVTDPSMLRYMMTPSQAIELILHASQLAAGGEVFVLKMPIVRLADLVEVVVEEVCEKYGISDAVHVEEIGIRSGEKRYEELMTAEEVHHALETELMYIILPEFGRKYRGYPIPFVPCKQVPIPRAEDAISRSTLKQWLVQEKILETGM